MEFESSTSRTQRRAYWFGALVALSLVGLWSFADLPVVTVTQVLVPKRYTCPSLLSKRPVAFSSESSMSEPISLSDTGDFAIDLSYDTTVCNAFVIIISRRDKARCAQSEGINPSADEEAHRWIRHRLGPDSFAVQVEGAERLLAVEPSAYLGDCEYMYTFRLNAAGPVWLSVKLVHEDYNGFLDEEHEAFSDPKPTLLNVGVLEWVQLDLCGGKCANFVASSLRDNKVLPFDSPLSRQMAQRVALPPCKVNQTNSIPPATGATETIDGGYFPASSVDLLYPNEPHYFSETRTTNGLTRFVPFACEWRHAGTRFADHASCLRQRRKVLFLGDSHARTMFHVLSHRLVHDRRDVMPVTQQPNKTVEATLVSMKDNLYLEYRWAPFLESDQLQCDKLVGFDSFVLNWGTHHLARHCSSVDQWRQDVERVLSRWSELLSSCAALAANKHRPPTLVQLTIPAFAEQHFYHDCRTGPRISFWNRMAGERFLAHGWQVLDMHALTLPLQSDLIHSDNVHFTKLDALDPLADELISRLDLCD